MPFHFTCPYCFKTTLVEDSLSGQEGPCVGCGKMVRIPAAPSKPAEEMQPVGNEYVSVEPQTVNRRFATRSLQALTLAVLVGVVSLVATYLLWPTMQGLRERRDKVACMNNLQKIAIALNAYAETHGSYPPPVVYDDKGKPMYSWRVLILNELGYAGLYAQFDLTQPWDSETNIAVIPNCPREFISPAADPAAAESNYALITGRGTIFPPAGPLGPRDILDGPENTLLVVEIENTANEWTKPLDIDYRKLNRTIGATGPNSIGGNHEGGAAAVFADGEPAWLPSDLDPVLLNSAISPRGNEPVDREDFKLK